MTPSRLHVLLAASALLGVLRVAFPPSKEDARVDAVVRSAPAATTHVSAPLGRAAEVASTTDVADVPGNAFSVRILSSPEPPAPVAVPVAVPPAATTQSVPAALALRPLAPAPAAEPLPPLQVVGTYDDGRTSAVFIATPMGIRMARPGTLLMSEYQVAGIASGRVLLTQVSSRRSFELPLPPGSRP